MRKKKITKKSKRRLILFGIPSIILVIYFCITFASYIYSFSSLKKEEKKLNNELYSLQEEKKQLKTEIQKLNDSDYIVRYAKEKYLYSSDGEYVIKIQEEEETETENEKSTYGIYIGLGLLAVILCFLFLKKKK
jgi:cell division protein DivIC